LESPSLEVFLIDIILGILI